MKHNQVLATFNVSAMDETITMKSINVENNIFHDFQTDSCLKGILEPVEDANSIEDVQSIINQSAEGLPTVKTPNC